MRTRQRIPAFTQQGSLFEAVPDSRLSPVAHPPVQQEDKAHPRLKPKKMALAGYVGRISFNGPYRAFIRCEGLNALGTETKAGGEVRWVVPGDQPPEGFEEQAVAVDWLLLRCPETSFFATEVRGVAAVRIPEEELPDYVMVEIDVPEKVDLGTLNFWAGKCVYCRRGHPEKCTGFAVRRNEQRDRVPCEKVLPRLKVEEIPFDNYCASCRAAKWGEPHTCQGVAEEVSTAGEPRPCDCRKPPSCGRAVVPLEPVAYLGTKPTAVEQKPAAKPRRLIPDPPESIAPGAAHVGGMRVRHDDPGAQPVSFEQPAPQPLADEGVSRTLQHMEKLAAAERIRSLLADGKWHSFDVLMRLAGAYFFQATVWGEASKKEPWQVPIFCVAGEERGQYALWDSAAAEEERRTLGYVSIYLGNTIEEVSAS